MDADGRIVAAGGNSDRGTSIYDSTSDSWSDGGVSNGPFVTLYLPKTKLRIQNWHRILLSTVAFQLEDSGGLRHSHRS